MSLPLYHIVRSLLLSRQLTVLLIGVWFRRFADQRQSQSKAKCTRGARPCLFFVFDFARSPTDAKPPDALPCGRCLQCASRYALRCESTTAGHPRRSCMPCKDVIPSSRLSFHFSLWWSPFGCPGHVLCNISPLAITLGCPVALARPQTLTKLLAPQPRIASLRPVTSSVAS